MQVPPFLAVLALSLYPRVLCAQIISAPLTGRVTRPVQSRHRRSARRRHHHRNKLSLRRLHQPFCRIFPHQSTSRFLPHRVEKSGFMTLIRPDVILHVQDALAIDFEMGVGSDFVNNMPLNGRSFQTLIMLMPGVVVTATAFDDHGQFSVNGQRADANYFTVDGVSANFGITGIQAAGGALPVLSALQVERIALFP